MFNRNALLVRAKFFLFNLSAFNIQSHKSTDLISAQGSHKYYDDFIYVQQERTFTHNVTGYYNIRLRNTLFDYLFHFVSDVIATCFIPL
jgi:hypothetical protein